MVGGFEVPIGGRPPGMARQVTAPEVEAECTHRILQGIKQGFNAGAAAVQGEEGFRVQRQI